LEKNSWGFVDFYIEDEIEMA